jgi:plasmid stabilization system protein ParE
MRVTFHPAAEIELYDAALYYESQQHGLGSAFLQAIETAMDEIRENPMASPRVQGVVRSKRVRRFPYSVMYSAENGDLRILAIANHKRRPLYWLRRQ